MGEAGGLNFGCRIGGFGVYCGRNIGLRNIDSLKLIGEFYDEM